MNQSNQPPTDPLPSTDMPASSNQHDNLLQNANNQQKKAPFDPDQEVQPPSEAEPSQTPPDTSQPVEEMETQAEMAVAHPEQPDEATQMEGDAPTDELEESIPGELEEEETSNLPLPVEEMETQAEMAVAHPGNQNASHSEIIAASLNPKEDEFSDLANSHDEEETLPQIRVVQPTRLNEPVEEMTELAPPAASVSAGSAVGRWHALIPHRYSGVPAVWADTVRSLTGRMQAIRSLRQQAPQAEAPASDLLSSTPTSRLAKQKSTPSLPLRELEEMGTLRLGAAAPFSNLPGTVGYARRSRTMHTVWLMRQRRERQEMRERRRKRVGTILGSLCAILLIILLSSGTGYAYSYYQSQQPRLQSIANAQVDQSTRIYASNNTLLYTLYDSTHGRGTPVTYQNIPGVMQDAMIAAEDPTFWTNIGVDPQGILRAFDQYVSSNGQVESGGSTLTQQLIKDLTNDTQVTFQRKLSEASLAIGLTREYPKWKILEMYFNTAPFGAQEQGVEAAAEDFFGLTPQCDANFNCVPAVAFLDRDLKQCKVTKPEIDESTCAENPLLGLARASFLAGMPQNPVIFDPTVDPAHIPLALQRQNYVLQQMLDDNMSINLGLGSQTKDAEVITPAIIREVEAMTKNIKFVGFQNGMQAPHFVDWIIQNLANELGDNQDLVNGISVLGLNILNTSGLNIRTTLDLNLEKYVERAINRHINIPEFQPFLGVTEVLSSDDNLHDSAVVVMDARTGEVLAMDGSANFNDRSVDGSGQINMALQPRQPGSAFKPIALAAAYQMGFYPGMVLPDKQTFFPEGQSQSLVANATSTYAPPDYGGGWHNINSNIEIAIANSFNIPALKIEYFVGLKNVYTMAARLGITSIDPSTGLVPSMVLGTDAVSLLQMVDAYQTFADQGIHVQPQGILDVWDNYGDHLYHYNTNHPAGVRVLSPQVAYLVTSTLDNNAARSIEFGGDPVLTLDNWILPNGQSPQVAAKTGTTDSFKDNWTIGFTPSVVVGVWSGNANDDQMENSIGVTGAAPIWNSVMYYVNGYCNQANDQIACPRYDLNYNKNHFFPVPNGIVQQNVNTFNGLAGAGFVTPMINGEQPKQQG